MKKPIKDFPEIMAVAWLLFIIVFGVMFLSGCSTLTESQKDKVVDASVTPGSDSRCIGVEGILNFQLCYWRSREEAEAEE